MLPAQAKIKPEITHNISLANLKPLPYFYRLSSVPLPGLKVSPNFVTRKNIVSMASFLNKWLFISVIPLLLFNKRPISDNIETKSSLRVPGGLHPFHVSVVEVNHNAADKTLEISCKIFTDDFEKVLEQNYKTRVDLINPPNKPAMDTLVKKYITSHLSLSADGKPLKLSYIGFERENEAVYGYVEVGNIVSVKKIDITNKLMHDLFTDQVNLMHVIVGGNRKSTKLDYPETQATFNF
jgi:hypothetical protein